MPRPSLRLLLFASFLLVPAVARAEPITATVVDAGSFQPIAGASLTLGGRTFVTDDAGQVLIGELPGATTITVSAPGYASVSDTLSPDVPPLLMLFRPDRAGEVIEIADHAAPASATSSTLIGRDEIRSLPGGGEDALAAVRSMPGVGQAPPTAGGRLVIRGSAPEDTRMTLDGISVPFLYHAFNNATIVPVASIASIDYTPGGFGVEEGRATGGLVALTTDDAIPTRSSGTASVSVLEVAASASVPLSKHYALAGGLRRSTVDLLAPYAVPDTVMFGFTTAPRFYDGQLRFDGRPTPRDRISVIGLLSSDALGVVNNDPDSELPSAFSTETRFARLIGTWKHDGERVDNRLVGALGSDHWHADIGIDQSVEGRSHSGQVRDDLRIEAAPYLQVRAGGSAELADDKVHAFSILPPTEGLPPGRIDQLPVRTIDARYDANYAAAYAAADVIPSRSTTLTAGLRVEDFAHLGQVRFLPRVQIRHHTGPFTFNAALGRYARDMDQAEGISRTLVPELATQATAGGVLELAEGVSTSLTGFYTWRRDLVVEDAMAGDLPYRSGGTGATNGFEVLVRAQRGNFFGWLAYTFSRSTRRDDAGGSLRPFAYDQPHMLSAVASYQRGPWQFGARWQLATGLPYTEITGATYDDSIGHYVPGFGPAYAARYGTQHQLDLRVERTWQRKGYRLAVFADLGNVYRHARVLRYQYSEDFMTRKPVTDMLPLPSIGVRAEL